MERFVPRFSANIQLTIQTTAFSIKSRKLLLFIKNLDYKFKMMRNCRDDGESTRTAYAAGVGVRSHWTVF